MRTHVCEKMPPARGNMHRLILLDTDGWYLEVEEYSIPISHCPWCGRELKP